jgi:hypothetical protein
VRPLFHICDKILVTLFSRVDAFVPSAAAVIWRGQPAWRGGLLQFHGRAHRSIGTMFSLLFNSVRGFQIDLP